MPGTYGSAAGQDNPSTATGYINSPVGFMETVQGLGASPDDVTINGNLPNQAAYMNGSESGYPSYEVTAGVSSHDATGLETWTFFFSSTDVFLKSAIKTVASPRVRFHNTTAAVIAGRGGIENVINDSGGSSLATGVPPSFVQQLSSINQLTSFPK